MGEEEEEGGDRTGDQSLVGDPMIMFILSITIHPQIVLMVVVLPGEG